MKRQQAFGHLRKSKEKIEKRRGKDNKPEAAEIPKQRVFHHKDQIIIRSFNEF
jgi:hypothetical protein